MAIQWTSFRDAHIFATCSLASQRQYLEMLILVASSRSGIYTFSLSLQIKTETIFVLQWCLSHLAGATHSTRLRVYFHAAGEPATKSYIYTEIPVYTDFGPINADVG